MDWPHSNPVRLNHGANLGSVGASTWGQVDLFCTANVRHLSGPMLPSGSSPSDIHRHTVSPTCFFRRSVGLAMPSLMHPIPTAPGGSAIGRDRRMHRGPLIGLPIHAGSEEKHVTFLSKPRANDEFRKPTLTIYHVPLSISFQDVTPPGVPSFGCHLKR